MEQRKLDRINELARKAKLTKLTEEDLAERDVLRSEYIAGFRENLRSQLDNIEIVDKPSKKD